MIRVSPIVEVNAPAEVVFAYVRDPHNQPNWMPNFLELIREPDGPPAPGTRYRGTLRMFGPVNFVIDQFEPDRMFRLDIDPPAGG
jgi:uncharacterized protein YndB with AHSA1/START domain